MVAWDTKRMDLVTQEVPFSLIFLLALKEATYF